MLTWIREKFGSLLIGLIIGGVAFVMVIQTGSNKGLSGRQGASAGSVNGEEISYSDFSRALRQKLEMFKGMGGDGLTEAQIKQYHVKDSVFQELVSYKLQIQQAKSRGMTPSDEEVRAKIEEIPAFQKNNAFDPVLYKQILAAQERPLTPALFEKMVREELAGQKLGQYYKSRVKVSDGEIRNQFILSGDQRNVKYVLLTNENGARAVHFESGELPHFLADPAKLNIAKSQFEKRKSAEFKGKTFDQVKEDIARQIIASSKTEEIKKENEKLAQKVAALMTADKKSDAQVNALLKSVNATVAQTGFFGADAATIPGIGEARDLMKDAFAAHSPINPKEGGRAKAYQSASWSLVAIITDSKSPDLSQLAAETDKIRNELFMRKERALSQSIESTLMKSAKIEKNMAILGDDKDSDG